MATQHAAVKRLLPPLHGFIVDGFNFCEPDVRHYFLTHCHSDHTCGLHSKFDLGTIYCSALSARVLRATLGIRQKVIVTLDVGETIEIEGVSVTALDAGHCPGSLMLLFVHPDGHRALHTGDCRASEPVIRAAREAALAVAVPTPGPAPTVAPSAATSATPTAPIATTSAASAAVDVLYLDTTYAQPRWTFPPQPAALEMLAAIVSAELAREPATLFVVGSYQLGKEKAISAVARAAGGRALVPSRRALTLRLCGLWDDAIHTEADSPDVRVHVSPMSGMGADAHSQMLSTLRGHGGRYKAIVTIRPTGWSFTKSMRDGASCKPWAENEGSTRLFGVPYSEHSSYEELHALVSALRPRTLVPTVNAETSKAREGLVAEFARSMDSASDKRRISWHFRRREEAGGADRGARGAGEARCAGGRGTGDALRHVDIDHQKELWRLLRREDAASPATADDDDAAALAQIREVVGAAPPDTYLRSLLADASGAAPSDAAPSVRASRKVELALGIHFGAHGGTAPSGLGDCVGDRGPSASTAVPVAGDDDDLALPPGTIAWVVGKEFKLYRSREELQSRLEALGAVVVSSGARVSKQEVTMIVVAEGTESGAVVRSACPNAMVVHESYVVRRSRALRAGRLVPAERPPPKPTPSRKRARAAPVTGEKRGARYRSMSAAGAARIERALTERLYLIERRDLSTASESGLVAHRHEFAVLGSTGNAYEVAICRKPSCTCAKAA